MLSQTTIRTIKSTVPALQVHGVDITKRFYQLLFSSHPELLNIFNHANQKQGKQPTALANAVYAAALHIDNLESILPVVKQIGHKHRSLGVKPEHYPIVGQHLLLAIKDVLGDAATDEILQAWGEAYGVIADVFISIEAEMYKQTEETVGGWRDYRNFVVQRKVMESEVITSFYLVPEDGKEIKAFEPGQYISVQINLPEGSHIRQYSLSDAPHQPYYRISVKREDAAVQTEQGTVSNYLHHHVQEGDLLSISAPAGDFVLHVEDNLPVVLISGGVGITPMVSMLNTLVKQAPERDIYFLHAALNSATHAFQEHVAQLAEQNDNLTAYFCYNEPSAEDKQFNRYDKEGYLDLITIEILVNSPNAQFYFCGPHPFMRMIYAGLREWGVKSEHIHYEFFGPAGSLES